MKVTRLGPPVPVLNSGFGNSYSVLPSGGSAAQVLTSDGSNGRYWGENVARITSNGSNTLLGPFDNFSSGSNITFSVTSNTLTIFGQSGFGGGSGSAALVVKDEGSTLTTDATALDFVGAGVTASGTGATKTITIPGSSSTVTREDGYTKPDTPGTYDEEFEGTADTLPTNWSWISTPSTWKLNSQWKSWLIADHPVSTAETKELRRASFTPGAVDFGLWWYMDFGLGQWNNNTSYMDLYVFDSAEAEGQGIRISKTSTLAIDMRKFTGAVDSQVASENASNNDTRSGIFCGMTRKTSDNTWRMYVSGNGVSWTKVGGADAHTLTPDRIRIRFNSGNNAGVERHSIDFVRYRADLLLWAPR